MIEWNVNEYVWVRLKKAGLEIHRKDHEDFVNSVGRRWSDGPEAARERFPYTPPKIDADGWTKFQGWQLMKLFGPHIYLGGEMPFETVVRFQADGEGKHG